MSKHIVVANSAWVFLGDVVPSDGDTLRLDNASVIRLWGTTRGLGEIALSGPTKNTVLDPCGTVVIRNASVLFLIPCAYDKE